MRRRASRSSVASLEELAQAVAAVSGQQATLLAEVQRLQAENQVLRAANPAWLNRVVQQFGQSTEALSTASATASASGGRQSLIDVKGLGKPPPFENEISKFTEWFKKTTGFLVAAYGAGFRPLL
jgi:hypothetical protein